MSLMHSVEFPADPVRDIRQMILAGVEHYVVQKNGFTYINVRTNDPTLIRNMMESGRRADQSCTR